MTEDESRSIIEARFGSAALGRLKRLVEMVVAENERQNLIAPSTLETIWTRHVLDSVQLIDVAPPDAGLWIDIGTGGGFPGLVVATVRSAPMLLVEPRRLRSQFLTGAAAELGMDHVQVASMKIEQVSRKAAVISARAVAPIEKLLRGAAPCATEETTWVFPRGHQSSGELESVRRLSGMMFHVKHSVTDPASVIAVGRGVPRR